MNMMLTRRIDILGQWLLAHSAYHAWHRLFFCTLHFCDYLTFLYILWICYDALDIYVKFHIIDQLCAAIGYLALSDYVKKWGEIYDLQTTYYYFLWYMLGASWKLWVRGSLISSSYPVNNSFAAGILLL